MTDNTKPEALDLADWLEAVGGGPSAKRCAALLREQHARIAELESELEAVGAGGVSGPLMGRASLSANAGDPVAWQYRSLPDVGGVWFDCTKERADLRAARPEIWEVRALYAAPPTAQAEGWISVAERLPAAYVTVLLTIDGKHITTGEYMHNLSCFSWDQHDDETDDSQATHWMPLPPPPTSAEGVEHG